MLVGLLITILMNVQIEIRIPKQKTISKKDFGMNTIEMRKQ